MAFYHIEHRLISRFDIMLQVCRDPRWGRCFESYSEDHKIVQAMTEIISGLQGDIPAKYLRNFPYVNGKYVQYTN